MEHFFTVELMQILPYGRRNDEVIAYEWAEDVTPYLREKVKETIKELEWEGCCNICKDHKVIEEVHADPCPHNGKEFVECFMCERMVPKNETVVYTLYDSPWKDATPNEVYVCSNEYDRRDREYSCEEALTWSGYWDWWYFYCDMCGRYVCNKNPQNGWMSFIREYDGEEVCLGCYEHQLITNGQPDSDFWDDRNDKPLTTITGGMFMDKSFEEAGFETFDTMFIDGRDKAARFNTLAHQKITEGYIVATEWGRMAYGGSEGTASLLIKKAEKKDSDE